MIGNLTGRAGAASAFRRAREAREARAIVARHVESITDPGTCRGCGLPMPCDVVRLATTGRVAALERFATTERSAGTERRRPPAG